jgi:hypothetical protein
MKISGAAFLIIVVSLFTVASLDQLHGADDSLKKSDVCGHRPLPLYAKDPVTWKIIQGGSSGVMTYDIARGIFTANAHGLSANTDYTLVRYANEPPYGDILAQAKSDATGGIHLSGNWKQWTGKIWLILSDDISRDGARPKLKAWHPARYLFEERELCGQ